MAAETVYLYVIGMQGSQAVKIGWTGDVAGRLSGLQTGSPFPLVVMWQQEVPAAPLVEAALHQRFKDKRVRGEWFDLGPDAVRVVREASAEITAAVPAALPATATPPADFLPLSPDEFVWMDAGRWFASLAQRPEQVSVRELIGNIRAMATGESAAFWAEMSDRVAAEVIRLAYSGVPEEHRMKGGMIPLSTIGGVWEYQKIKAQSDPRLAFNFLLAAEDDR